MTANSSRTLGESVRKARVQAWRWKRKVTNIVKALERAGVQDEVGNLNARMHQGKTGEIEQDLRESLFKTQSLALLAASSQGTPLYGVLDEKESHTYLCMAVERQDFFGALLMLRYMPEVASQLSLTQARKLMKGIRQLGFLEESSMLMDQIAEKSGKQSDVKRAALLKSEYDLYAGLGLPEIELPPLEGGLDSRVVLHFVGKALPDTQTGYTLRTHYTVQAQIQLGIEPLVVRQAGVPGEKQQGEYFFNGVRYRMLSGPSRNTIPWDKWLGVNISQLSELVREIRPCILHAHSDFLNAIIVQAVGDAYGIPVVNETRGFWEESWLSRKSEAEGWRNIEQVEGLYGLPTAYTLRKEREAEYRNRADVVVTLADVMKTHIERLSSEYGQPVKKIAVIPNAVEAEKFPVTSKDDSILQQHGIPEDATVIGYISSLVEYEGIDTLVKGFSLLSAALKARETNPASEIQQDYVGGEKSTGVEDGSVDLVSYLGAMFPDLPNSQLIERASELRKTVLGITDEIHLLIVGDGPERQNLEDLAVDLGISDVVTFTGKVPHSHVVEHYGLIDLFVVPRRPSSVTELVTPLKPFEAMSTGRPCVFSDVGALKEIATQSGSAATFAAGDDYQLALTMATLMSDPVARSKMARDGAAWVRSQRTWDANARSYLEIYESLGLRPRG